MTRDDLKKLWNVIEAFKDGKEIEFFNDTNQEWVPIDNPVFYGSFQYRIAPRDWAWACKMMLEGKKVTSLATGVLGIGDDRKVMFFPSNGTPWPSTIERLHLTTTDYRLA